MILQLYTYRCTVTRVVDGDTLDVDIDLGLRVHTKARVRLLGVDTPETYGVRKDSEEWKAGQAAKTFVEHWLGKRTGRQLVLRTTKDKTGKYGRWLGTLHVEQAGVDDCLNDALMDKGWARD